MRSQERAENGGSVSKQWKEETNRFTAWSLVKNVSSDGNDGSKRERNYKVYRTLSF